MVSVTIAAYSVENNTKWTVKFKEFNHIPVILCVSDRDGV